MANDKHFNKCYGKKNDTNQNYSTGLAGKTDSIMLSNVATNLKNSFPIWKKRINTLYIEETNQNRTMTIDDKDNQYNKD